MNTQITEQPFKINQLVCEIDRNLFDERYDIFSVSTTADYFPYGAYIFDAPAMNNNVCSVRFLGGNTFYVLMRRDDGNKVALKEALTGTKEFETITLRRETAHGVADHILLQMLLNAMGGYERASLRLNNLTGHFYCFHPGWLKKGTHGGKKVIEKVPCLELEITSDLLLVNYVRTFTSEHLRKFMDFSKTKKKFEAHAKYVLSAHNTLRRKLKDDKETVFIMRQTIGGKSDIPFLPLTTLSSFEKSKVGVIGSVMEEFNSRYQDLAHIEFQEVSQYESLEYRLLPKENRDLVSRLFSSMPVNIVDCIGTESSMEFCARIASLLYTKHEVTAFIGDTALDEHLNIRLIHEPDYYKEHNMEDPHNQVFNAAVQHITFENFANSCDQAIEVIVHEVLIKEDLKNGKINLFDWNDLGFTEDLVFGYDASSKETDQYVFMTVHPDGSFDFTEQGLDLFEENLHDDCANIFQAAKDKREDLEGILKDASGNINIIKKSKMITFPEFEKIRGELASGRKMSRGKEVRDELFTACLDIKMFEYGGKSYYFAGLIGSGMKVKVQNAANIREICAVSDSSLLLPKILPLMNIKFVRNGQLTVIPFPFKYIREYLNAKKQKELDPSAT